ncbi:MAG: hypothetical protein U9O87_00270, partial [Verrucomicrobiota bacterium]|nr:hypothetical protein [Verrucomicrobiota bacterium]
MINPLQHIFLAQGALSMLKYPVFFGVLIFGVPIGYLFAMKDKRIENAVFFTAIFFTCRLYETINFFSDEFYRGTAKGFEITLVDIATIILFLIVIARKEKYPIKIL